MRILVVDDDDHVLKSYEHVFCRLGVEKTLASVNLEAISDSLFGAGDDKGSGPEATGSISAEVDYVTQGHSAVSAVETAIAEGRGYAVIFLDMRMPPGIDGKETAKQIRALDRSVNIVLVTGYSDHSPQTVAAVAPPVDKLFYLSKPFDADEILQLATALDARWRLDAELHDARILLGQQMASLEVANVELVASEARAAQAALRDPLTGMANRVAFLKVLGQRLSDPALEAGVLFIDLDRFKVINDTLGHHAGDELVRVLGRSLESVLPPGSLLARMGGDEFAALVPTSAPDVLQEIAERLVGACSQSFGIMGNTVQSGASVGVAWREGTESVASDLLRKADLALYAAKRDGRGRSRLFDLALDESAKVRGQIESGLKHAIANDQLYLLYQPIVDQASGGISGFEALVRWRREDGEVISPSAFIPIAEESNLIQELGDWVVRRAFRDCAGWGGPIVSINLSPRQFRRSDLVRHLEYEALVAGVPHDRVQLEITETSLFESMSDAAEILHQLRARGFKVALDDFGTGYASLVYLRNFEIDCIKIDGSFVAGLGHNSQSPAIINAIAHLARTLGMAVVAEGVEDVFQQQALRLAGCGFLQGFLLGRPMSIENASALLAAEAAALTIKPASPDADAPAFPIVLRAG